MKFDFHPQAEAEFHEAISFYSDRGAGLGEDFALEIYAALRNILSYPKAWPIVEEDVRRCLVNRFPFGVLYSIEPDRIYILAVMHLRRSPDYWKNRR